MPVITEPSNTTYTPIKAPRGNQLSCKGWVQEAAMRMLMNNLDPDVGERPQDLVVYGGTGKAARNWDCYHAIVNSLRSLGRAITYEVARQIALIEAGETAQRHRKPHQRT